MEKDRAASTQIHSRHTGSPASDEMHPWLQVWTWLMSRRHTGSQDVTGMPHAPAAPRLSTSAPPPSAGPSPASRLLFFQLLPGASMVEESMATTKLLLRLHDNCYRQHSGCG